MQKTCWLLVVFLVLAVGTGGGCAPTHAGRTLGRGVLQLEGNLGGPFIRNLGPSIPVPNLPLGARYGVTHRLDVAAHLNLLPLAMGGFMALDAGVTYGLVKHEGRSGPNLATQLGAALLTDFKEGARISPTLDLVGGYTFGWFTPFAGAEFAVDAWGGRLIGNFFAGFEADIGNLTLAASGVWFTPWFDTYSSVVDYESPDQAGAVGCLLGVKYRFHLPGAKEEGHE
jgi:hypothetical protein